MATAEQQYAERVARNKAADAAYIYYTNQLLTGQVPVNKTTLTNVRTKQEEARTAGVFSLPIPQHTTVLSKAMHVLTATPMDRKTKKKKKRTRKKSFKINAINKYKAGIKTSSNKPVGIQQLGEGGLNV